MPLNDIVNVQITRETQSVSKQGFGTLLILGTFKNWNDLLRKYSNLQEVAVDFSPSQKEYIAAQDVFSQNITPDFIYIGRRAVDTVNVNVETNLPAHDYTVTINGVNITVPSTLGVEESTLEVLGNVVVTTTFTPELTTDNVVTPTINGIQLPPTAYNTTGNITSTMNALAASMTKPGEYTSVRKSSSIITTTFVNPQNAVIDSVVVAGGAIPAVAIAYTGPLVTNNLINVSLNGNIVGTVTSIINFSTTFTAGDVATAQVNGLNAAPVAFTTTNAQMLADIAAAILILAPTSVTSATVTGSQQITVVFTNPGNNTVNAITTVGGSAPTATINEGGFLFNTNNLTTMNDIAIAIALQPNIASAVVSGQNNTIITVTSDPTFAGVIDFFIVTLGASQASTNIVNTIQPTTSEAIASLLVSAINLAALGVTATAPVVPDGTFTITANAPGFPYTITVSTNIINPDAARVTVTQAIPNQAYSVRINGTDFTYQAQNDVSGSIEIAAGLVALINALVPPITGNKLQPVTATDNFDGSFEINADVTGNTFILQVSPPEVLTIQQGLIIDPYTPSLPVTTDLDNIVAVNDDWYALMTTDRTTATVISIAAWVEARIKLFGTTSSDPQIVALPPGTGPGQDSTSIAYLFFSLGYVRTFVMYHEDADLDFPEAAWFGVVLPMEPGSETWKFKTLNGISYSNLNSNEQNNALAKNANIYTFVGGVGITANGTVAQGEFIDIIRGIDWLTSRIQEFVFSVLVNSPKIAYTDAGIAIIQAEVMRALQLGQDNNFLAENPPYLVTVPLAANVPPVDKANRILRNVKFTATLAGAIHAVRITGTVGV